MDLSIMNTPDPLQTFTTWKDAHLERVVKPFPSWMTPNRLTMLRIVISIPLVWAAGNGRILEVGVLFLFSMITDLLDGPLARTSGQVTEFGKYADPIADKLIFLPLIYLIGHRLIPGPILWSIVGLEIALIFTAVVLKPIGTRIGIHREAGANLYGKIKMAIQTIGALVLLASFGFSSLLIVAQGLLALSIPFSVLSIVKHLLPRRSFPNDGRSRMSS
jgi:CDP-diacylglycerol--glycerol-3-phosphate 3-phosphatidyltransferase